MFTITNDIMRVLESKSYHKLHKPEYAVLLPPVWSGVIYELRINKKY